MKENIILQDIKKMLVSKYPAVEITMDTFLENGENSSLEMSSLDIVQFIVDLEERYKIIIDFEDRYYTVGDVVKSIAAYIENKAID